jgi:hypothetical protein
MVVVVVVSPKIWYFGHFGHKFGPFFGAQRCKRSNTPNGHHKHTQAHQNTSKTPLLTCICRVESIWCDWCGVFHSLIWFERVFLTRWRHEKFKIGKQLLLKSCDQYKQRIGPVLEQKGTLYPRIDG